MDECKRWCGESSGKDEWEQNSWLDKKVREKLVATHYKNSFF